ncbi:MAG TPA: MBL fold metallo-hydrolase [Vicinamibacterales bacterium]|nr:MBL fold metallo-hydrolase [Vicinamibacterales bacterium]
MRITYIGGPTALLEVGGVSLLTDPTFDPAGERYELPVYTLEKTAAPAVAAADLPPIDAVLLSHDHHADNLDRAGRRALTSARRVLTTVAGAERLGGAASGLAPWETIDVAGAGGSVAVTATPARHGPADGDRGPVVGFIVRANDRAREALYVSGDTVWFDGVAEVARRFDVRVALLFLGAARVAAVGNARLTLSAEEGVTAARAMPDAAIVPMHFEGWKHFSEGRPEIEGAFASAGLASRLVWPTAGQSVELHAF